MTINCDMKTVALGNNTLDKWHIINSITHTDSSQHMRGGEGVQARDVVRDEHAATRVPAAL